MRIKTFSAIAVHSRPGIGCPAPAPAADGSCPAGYTCRDAALARDTDGTLRLPSAGQTKGIQLSEEQQCYDWAQQQASIDPTTVTANTDSAAKASGDKAASATQGAAVGGAARGAAAGALIGAAAGDAGTGAAVGAAAGAVGGRRAKKRAEAQAAQSGANQAVAVANDKIVQFKKAMTACLEGKGYTVK